MNSVWHLQPVSTPPRRLCALVQRRWRGAGRGTRVRRMHDCIAISGPHGLVKVTVMRASHRPPQTFYGVTVGSVQGVLDA
jgi:hypothetical protein